MSRMIGETKSLTIATNLRPFSWSPSRQEKKTKFEYTEHFDWSWLRNVAPHLIHKLGREEGGEEQEAEHLVHVHHTGGHNSL